MKSKSLILAMVFTATGLLTLSGCKLSMGNPMEDSDEVKARYENEDGDFQMPDNGDGARLAMGGLTIGSNKVKALSIDWITDTVTIEGYDGTDVVVSEVSDEELNDSNSMYYSLSPEGKLSLLFCKPGIVIKKGTVLSKHLFVRVPRTLKMDELVVDGGSHTVQLDGVSSKEMDVKGLVNSVQINECELGNMKVDIACSPAVEARFTQMPDKIELNSSGCTAVLYVPKDAGISFDLDGMVKKFDCDLPVTRKGKARVAGDGHCKLVMNQHCTFLKVRTEEPKEWGAELWNW